MYRNLPRRLFLPISSRSRYVGRTSDLNAGGSLSAVTAASCRTRGLASHTPRRRFNMAISIRYVGLLIRPIDGELGPPEIETADRVPTSRRRPVDGASLCSRFHILWKERIRVSRCSYSAVGTEPTSGPPTWSGENTKPVTLRPGGV